MTPVEFTDDTYQCQRNCFDKHDITVPRVITYIYLCGDGM